jgi:alpha-tubulin suppressor-like RCC1 family protein
MQHKKFRIFRRRFNFKKGLMAAMAVGLAVVGAQNLATNFSQAANWTVSNIQGTSINSSNNPGGYTDNTPSQSPANGTNFSPAFGSVSGSTLKVNGSGFLAAKVDVNAKAVKGGDGSACYLSNAPDSWLYCWGNNVNGQLGDGTTAARTTPTPIVRGQMSDSEKIVEFAAGFRRACAITDAHKTYCWGNNGNGELGVSGSSNLFVPNLVSQGDLPNGAYFKSISAGQTHTCAISDTDEAYCWGYGWNGKLGLGNTSTHFSPKKVKTISSGGGNVMPDTVKSLSAGSDGTCAIASDDMVYCWGTNGYGQLGDNSTTNKSVPTRIYGLSGTVFKQVELSVGSTCALTDAGQIYCWGRNNYGQLGNGTTSDSSVPIAISGLTFSQIGASDPRNSNGFCATTDKNLGYCWGSGNGNTPKQIQTASNGGTIPDELTSITRFGYGAYDLASCMVAADGKVYCSGVQSSERPMLGSNSDSSSSMPTQVVQFAEVPKIQFDDAYGVECQSVVVLSDSQLRCLVSGTSANFAPSHGLHDVLVTFRGTTQTLPQSYMYKTTPQQPTNFTAIGRNKSVHLEWDWQSEKPYFVNSNFYVECRRSDKTTYVNPTTHSCDSAARGSSSIGSTSQKTVDIVGLENGVAYDFTVRTAFNATAAQGVFQYGIVPQASSYVPTPPVITSVNSSSSSATFTWSPPASNGGAPVTNYALQVQQYNETGYGMANLYLGNVTSSGATNITFSTAGPSKVSVIALNANGASAPSQEVEVWGSAAAKPPGPPTGVKVNNVNTDQTMLSWSAPPNNGSAITKYEVRYSQLHDFSDWKGTAGTDTCVSATPPSPPTTSCVTDSLAIGAKYYFQVRATNAKGTSDWSVIHASVVGAPDRPVISTVTPRNAEVYVAWNAPGDNGAAITNYQLQYDTDPNFANATTVNTGTTPNYTLTPATNGSIYYFQILATNSRGDSPWSDPVSAVPYAPPSNLTISPNQGLMTGGELTTISGDNLSGATSVTIGGNDCKTFAVVDDHTINCLTPAGMIGMRDVVVTNLGGSAKIVWGYTYGIPNLSLTIDHDIDFEVTSPGMGTVSSFHTVNVKTDSPNGYKLSLAMIGSNQNLESGWSAIRPTNAIQTATALPLNTWGHSVIDAKNHWTSVPPSAQPKLIKTTTTTSINGMSGPGDDTKVYYGVNVGLDQQAGTYTSRVLYTALAEF